MASRGQGHGMRLQPLYAVGKAITETHCKDSAFFINDKKYAAFYFTSL